MSEHVIAKEQKIFEEFYRIVSETDNEGCYGFS